MTPHLAPILVRWVEARVAYLDTERPPRIGPQRVETRQWQGGFGEPLRLCLDRALQQALMDPNRTKRAVLAVNAHRCGPNEDSEGGYRWAALQMTDRDASTHYHVLFTVGYQLKTQGGKS